MPCSQLALCILVGGRLTPAALSRQIEDVVFDQLALFGLGELGEVDPVLGSRAERVRVVQAVALHRVLDLGYGMVDDESQAAPGDLFDVAGTLELSLS